MTDGRAEQDINNASDGTDRPHPMSGDIQGGCRDDDFFVQIRPKSRDVLHVEGRRVADVRVYSDGSMRVDTPVSGSAYRADAADTTGSGAGFISYTGTDKCRDGQTESGEYIHRTEKYYDTAELFADEVFRDDGIHFEPRMSYTPAENSYTMSRTDASELGETVLYGTVAEELRDSTDFYDGQTVGLREDAQYCEPVADTAYASDGIERIHGADGRVVYEALINESAERWYEGGESIYDTRHEEYSDIGESELYSDTEQQYSAEHYSGREYNAYDEYAELSAVTLNNGEPIVEEYPEQTLAEQDVSYSCDLSPRSVHKKQRKRDIGYIESRLRDRIRKIELGISETKYSFSKKNTGLRGALRKRRDNRSLRRAKRQLVAAIKYEKADNERYYRPLNKRFDKERLPKHVDRRVITELREKLDRLLERRDELNIRLTAIYSGIGIGKGGSSQGRFDAEMKGRRKAYKKQERLARVLYRNKVRRLDREHLFDLMDKWVALYGQRKKLEYMLGTEKIGGAYAKQLRRQRKDVIKEARRLKRDIAKLEAEVVVKARKKNKSKRNMILGWSALIVLCAVGLGVYVFREQIWQLISDAMDALFDKLGWTYFNTL